MSLSDYQWSYAGVICGPGTKYHVNSFEGLRSMPTLRTSDWARLHHHGAFSGVDVLEGRTLTVMMTVVGTSAADLDATLSALDAATVPLLTGALPLSFKLPNQVVRRVNARARKRSLAIDPTYKLCWAKVAVEFFCGDPRILSDSVTTTVVAASGSITNAGNFGSRPVVTVTPSSSPVTIANASDSGNIIVLAGSIPNPCIIDLELRTVIDGTGANRFDCVASSTTWTELVPGANALTITGGSMSVDWRSAWI